MRSFYLFAILLGLAHAAPAVTTTYAATNVGPMRSTDGGATWQLLKVSVSNPLLQGVPDTVAMAVDPTNASILYLLAGVSGTSAVFKSTDAGQSWTAVILPGVGVGSGTQAVHWLCIDPVATSTIYVEASNKVLRSTDGGATWTDLAMLATAAGIGGVLGIAVDPKTSGVLYATSSGGGINKSTDFGSTWSSVKLQFGTSPTIGGIFVDPVNPQRLYVPRVFGQGCLSQSRVAEDCAMFRSSDAGKTWDRVAIPGTSRSVAFDRATGDIYLGANQPGVGSAVLKSSDQGATWSPLIKGAGGVNNGPAVSTDPGTPGLVYSLGDDSVGGQFQRSTNGGTNWAKPPLPVYCTSLTPGCGSSVSGTPRVNSLAYVAPPPPPAVSVLKTTSAASLQDGPVAPESIVIATGAHLATGSATGDLDQPPMILAGTTVNVTDAAGISRPAGLFSVSATQIVYQMPPGTAPGAATVTITAGDGVTGTVQVQVAPVAPGIYTLNAAGLAKGYALRMSGGTPFIEDVFDIDETGAVIARPVTISNGDQVYLIVYGTGFRAAGGDISATVGGISAPVLYAGPQGVQPGLDQFNILLPPELAAGGPQLVPIVLTAAGQTANTVTVAIR
jgi:uncharacterized protein (TIGR03437 family)